MDGISECDFRANISGSQHRGTFFPCENDSEIDEKNKVREDIKTQETSLHESVKALSIQVNENSENNELLFMPKRCEIQGDNVLSKICCNVTSSPIFPAESRSKDLSFSPISNNSSAYQTAQDTSNLVKQKDKENFRDEVNIKENDYKSPTSSNEFKNGEFYYKPLNEMSPSIQTNSSDMSIEHDTEEINTNTKYLYHEITNHSSTFSSSKNSSGEENTTSIQPYSEGSISETKESSKISQILKEQKEIEEFEKHEDRLKIPKKVVLEKNECFENKETVVNCTDENNDDDKMYKKDLKTETEFEIDKKTTHDLDVRPNLATSSIQMNRQNKSNFTSPSYTKIFLDKETENKSKGNIRFKLPNESLCAKIIRQAESYFTDFNVLKNNFLLKHIRRNKEGYVSLKLVASFRKVKSLTRDWTVVAYCLANSKMLELNPEKTKVRRIEPIPKIEDTSFGKTIVIFNLPFQNTTTDQLINMFGKHGSIVYAEVMNRESKNYNIYHQRCLFFNQEISSYTFGVVEFEHFKDTQKAIKENESHFPKENKMAVVPLLSKYKTKKRKFRYRSNISHPQQGYEKFMPKNGYVKEAYPAKICSDTKINKIYNNNEILPVGKFSYGPNYMRANCYHQAGATKHQSQQICYPKSSQGNVAKAKNGQCHYKAPENWRSNRQLKANTSLNIEKRSDHSMQKPINSANQQIGTKIEST